MKIKEYIQETLKLIEQFEYGIKSNVSATELSNLLEVIENREGDIFMWHMSGLTDEDLLPISPDKVIMPTFLEGVKESVK
jgi:hypothetical protein